MKKNFLAIIFTLCSGLCFSQSLDGLLLEQHYNYFNKPLFIKSFYYNVEDINGKIEKVNSPQINYTWFDWNNRIVKHIEYNNLQHPCEYEELTFNTDGLIQKYIRKSAYSNINYLFEYSSDFSSYTIYELIDSKKEKYIVGEYVKENDALVYYEYEYDEGEISSAYKITGPNLSGDVRKYTINATEENPMYKYSYEENELDSIEVIYGNDFDYYEITYSKENEPVYYHTILDKNKNPTYSSSTSKWGGEYKTLYKFDKFGNPTTQIFYTINKEFEIDYLKPNSCYEYKYYYSPDKEIFEPKLPEILYSYFEEDESKSPVKESSSIKNTTEVTVTGLWEKAYYVDSFGDYTSETYLRLKERVSGTFSNTATTNSRLLVQFLIDGPNEMAIKLFEYGNSEVKNYSSNPSSYYIYVKDENGDTHMFSGRNTSDRIIITESDCIELHRLMMSNNSLKFHLTYETNNTYNFTLIIDQSYRQYFK